MDRPLFLCSLASGLFFVVGLACGAWKYWHIHHSPRAEAPVYVDIAHRSSLMYAFACLVIRHFVELSQLPETIELVAVSAQLLFFGLAVLSYIIHGVLRDTDNQLQRPHRLGSVTMPESAMVGFMFALIAAELGGFLVLVYGWIF